MMLIELVKDRDDARSRRPTRRWPSSRRACRKGVIAMRAGLFTNGIRFLPPLTITDEQLREGLDVIEQALAEVEAARAGLRQRRPPAAGVSGLAIAAHGM